MILPFNWFRRYFNYKPIINKGMQANIKRFSADAKQTLGEFTLTDNGNEIFRCKTLELPWLNNATQKSCIPTGTYKVVPRTSAKFKNHFHVTDVTGRSYILIHAGNYFTDILGCILVGDAHKDVNGDGFRDVVNSKNTLNKLLDLAPNGFELSIT